MVIRWTGSGASAAWCGMRCIEVSCDAWHAEGGEVGRAEHEKVQGEELDRGIREGERWVAGGNHAAGVRGKGPKHRHICVFICACVLIRMNNKECWTLRRMETGRHRGGGH